MEYSNKHAVRFKIHEHAGCYTVKFYSDVSKWPRIYRKFYVSDDETRREMFYILNNSRLCTICQDTLIDDSRSTCRDCLLRAAASVPEDDIAECPICYNKMFRVNDTKRKLACGHELCRVCMLRLTRSCSMLYVDPYGNPRTTCTIMCPLCRAVGWYDYSLNILSNRPPDPPRRRLTDSETS